MESLSKVLPSVEQIDAYTLEQELNYLISKAEEYNTREDILPENRIPLSKIGNDKVKLIFSLWRRIAA
jgi:hypothetical protein